MGHEMEVTTWPNWQFFFRWLADNFGPAVPYAISGVFAVWAAILKIKGDAARRSDELAKETREEARKKQEKADREAAELRLENERVKTVAFEKAEKLLQEERERSADLIAEKIHHMNGKLQVLENQLGIARMQSERDALRIEALEERLGEAKEKLNARERDLSEALKVNDQMMQTNVELRKRLNELESELRILRDGE